MNTNISRHRFLLAAVPLTLLLCGIVHGASAEAPNIVLILADDFGWGDAQTKLKGSGGLCLYGELLEPEDHGGE